MPPISVSSSKPPTSNSGTRSSSTSNSSSSSSPSSGAIAGIVVGCTVVLVLLLVLAVWAHKSRKSRLEKNEHAGKDEKDVEAGKAGAETGDVGTGLGGHGTAEAAAAAVAAAAVRQEEAVAAAAAAVAEARPMVCRQYSLAEVAAATGEWAEANRIGSGSFGDVYKGANPTAPHDIWAVKRAKILTNDFKREVNEMATKNHPNLVRLLGYCFDMNHTTERIEQIVIYEFMSNGDLERWIGPHAPKQLTIRQRLDVMIGMAQGLQYLHGFGIVHRDIKPANVLLDNKMQVCEQCGIGQVAPLIAAGDVSAFKDPHLQAPDDLVLRMAKLAISCTVMPTASRPSMNRILAELLEMKDEFLGAESNRMAEKIDRELESSSEIDFIKELARAQGMGSSIGLSSGNVDC
ncbi:unnamed protein product [Closterium sp. NIES-54]